MNPVSSRSSLVVYDDKSFSPSQIKDSLGNLITSNNNNIQHPNSNNIQHPNWNEQNVMKEITLKDKLGKVIYKLYKGVQDRLTEESTVFTFAKALVSDPNDKKAIVLAKRLIIDYVKECQLHKLPESMNQNHFVLTPQLISDVTNVDLVEVMHELPVYKDICNHYHQIYVREQKEAFDFANAHLTIAESTATEIHKEKAINFSRILPKLNEIKANHQKLLENGQKDPSTERLISRLEYEALLEGLDILDEVYCFIENTIKSHIQSNENQNLTEEDEIVHAKTIKNAVKVQKWRNRYQGKQVFEQYLTLLNQQLTLDAAVEKSYLRNLQTVNPGDNRSVALKNQTLAKNVESFLDLREQLIISHLERYPHFVDSSLEESARKLLKPEDLSLHIKFQHSWKKIGSGSSSGLIS